MQKKVQLKTETQSIKMETINQTYFQGAGSTKTKQNNKSILKQTKLQQNESRKKTTKDKMRNERGMQKRKKIVYTNLC